MSAAILPALIHPNAKQLFAEHCEEIHRTWKELLQKTTLPNNTTSTDSRVLDAIRALDNTIKCPESRDAARLAYVQLTRVLADLRKKVQDDRRQGLIVGKRSQRDATVAINIYLEATGRANRGDVHKLMSNGNRWDAIAGRYPLLLFTLTETAESIIYKTHMPNHRLQALAEEISRVVPTALIVASDYVAKDAELAVISGLAYDTGRAQEVFAQVKKMLT